MAERPKPLYKEIEGLRLPPHFNENLITKALDYKPDKHDIFVVTFPKCGTHWACQLLSLILQKGLPQEGYLDDALYLEAAGVSENAMYKRILFSHLPFHLIPFSSEAKYVYVARNPKDCCVSFYLHTKAIPFYRFTGTMDDFFQIFISGANDYGDYTDHLCGWYAKRDLSNVLIVTYEALKENPECEILRMASFLGEEYAAALKLEGRMGNIISLSSVEYMRELVKEKVSSVVKNNAVTDSHLSSDMRQIVRTFKDNTEQIEAFSSAFVGKGIVGDWKNYLNEEQSERLEKRFWEKTKGTDIPTLWKNNDWLSLTKDEVS